MPPVSFPYGAAHESELQYLSKRKPVASVVPVLCPCPIPPGSAIAVEGNDAILDSICQKRQCKRTADAELGQVRGRHRQIPGAGALRDRTKSTFASAHHCEFWSQNCFRNRPIFFCHLIFYPRRDLPALSRWRRPAPAPSTVSCDVCPGQVGNDHDNILATWPVWAKDRQWTSRIGSGGWAWNVTSRTSARMTSTPNCCPLCSADDLKELGITSLGHHHRLIEAITELRPDVLSVQTAGPADDRPA